MVAGTGNYSWEPQTGALGKERYEVENNTQLDGDEEVQLETQDKELEAEKAVRNRDESRHEKACQEVDFEEQLKDHAQIDHCVHQTWRK